MLFDLDHPSPCLPLVYPSHLDTSPPSSLTLCPILPSHLLSCSLPSVPFFALFIPLPSLLSPPLPSVSPSILSPPCLVPSSLSLSLSSFPPPFCVSSFCLLYLFPCLSLPHPFCLSLPSVFTYLSQPHIQETSDTHGCLLPSASGTRGSPDTRSRPLIFLDARGTYSTRGCPSILCL